MARLNRNRHRPAVLLVAVLHGYFFVGFPILLLAQESNAQRDAIIVPECRVIFLNKIDVSAERSGVLSSVATQGSSVTSGQPVVQIRDSTARAAYLITQRESSNDVEIRFAKKASQLAQLKYERAQQADRKLSGTVTEFELRELRLDAERSLLQLQQAEHQFQIAQLKMQEQLEQLKLFQIAAPFDGFVRATQKKSGEYIQEGEKILELVNDKLMKVEGSLSVDDLPFVSQGSPVSVYFKLQNGMPVKFRGHIDFIDMKIEPISMKARVSAVIQNDNSLLKDGYLVTMAIEPNPANRVSAR